MYDRLKKQNTDPVTPALFFHTLTHTPIPSSSHSLSILSHHFFEILNSYSALACSILSSSIKIIFDLYVARANIPLGT